MKPSSRARPASWEQAAPPLARGNIVLINGTSSSGKSSLARELQEIMDEPYLHLGLDHFIHNLPQRCFVLSDGVNPSVADYFLVVFPDGTIRDDLPEQDDAAAVERMGTMTEVRIGPGGLRFFAGMYRALAALAQAGVNVIHDDVIHDPRVLVAAVDALADLDVLFVGLRLPQEVAEQRERRRGNRVAGGAAAFHQRVHAHGVYDLELDTSTLSPLECALEVKRELNGSLPRHAFRDLAARRAG